MRQKRTYFVALLAYITTASAGLAQTLGRAPDDAVSFWRVAGALIVCVALGVAAAFFLRARGGAMPALPKFPLGGRNDRRLQLIEVLRLNHHVDLCLVRCDGATMLLAASSQGVAVLPYTGELSRERAGPEQGR